VHLVFDIFQGIGVAAAVGIRPFLPTLVVGALAAGDVQIDFKGTGFAFLQHAPFLLVMVLGAIAFSLAERRLGGERLQRRGPAAILGLVAVVLGALLFAAALAQGHYSTWPGYIGGVVCAAVGIAATVPLFARVRGRLDASAQTALPLFTEGGALLLAALSVLLPPVGLLGLVGLLWLLFAGRGREQSKYAGLRILR
jgi:asparagine N-glycosylation enzyme membrane subunit Stt3